MNITIIGLGAFGYALLKHLDKLHKEHTLIAWDVREEVLGEMSSSGNLVSMHDTSGVSSRVKITSNLETAISESNLVFLCIASSGLREVLHQIKPWIQHDTPIVNVAKALDTEGQRISELVTRELHPFYGQFGVLSGATRADDILNQRFVCATFASEHTELASLVQEILSSPTFHLETTMDVEATEMAGVAKNLITLLYGYLKGYGYSETQAAFVVAQTMFEMEERHPALRSKALMPAWNVDVWMSSHTSTRNVRCGMMLGKKAANEERSESEIGTSEGWRTLQTLPDHLYLVEIPGFRLLYQRLVTQEISQEEFAEQLSI